MAEHEYCVSILGFGLVVTMVGWLLTYLNLSNRQDKSDCSLLMMADDLKLAYSDIEFLLKKNRELKAAARQGAVITGEDAVKFHKQMEEAEELARNSTPELIAERKRLKGVYEAIMARSTINR